MNETYCIIQLFMKYLKDETYKDQRFINVKVQTTWSDSEVREPFCCISTWKAAMAGGHIGTTDYEAERENGRGQVCSFYNNPLLRPQGIASQLPHTPSALRTPSLDPTF
jgi:hypothetical protein